MNNTEAMCIVQSLAEGRCPVTGERFPPESAYQNAKVTSALRLAVKALSRAARRDQWEEGLPGRAGHPWDAAEDQQLSDAFTAGHSLGDLAKIHQRTKGAIQSRLERLGKLPPRP